MDQWEIRDNTGTIHSGSRHETFLTWDLTTRTLEDLASEYRRTYTRAQLEDLHREKAITKKQGKLMLIEIHEVA